MKRVAQGIAAGAAMLWVVAFSANATFGNELRVPQVPINGAWLQWYFNHTVGESINVYADQMNVQNWSTAVSGNSTFTVMIELSETPSGNTIGIYNCDGAWPIPPRFPVFPGYAGVGWHALAHFSGSSLTVTLFDGEGLFWGQDIYSGVDRDRFGFYLEGPAGSFYTQDVRNGGDAQALAYMGTGVNFGQWWMCWEDSPYETGDRDFDDCVLFLESVAPVSVRPTAWARVKAMFR